MRATFFFAPLALLVFVGCGGGSPPPAESGPRPERREPVSKNVEIVVQCATAVPIYFGEQPNGTTGSFVNLRGGSTSHIARDDSGELTVWIVDDKGFGKAHVRVTKKMSHVEIGPSCSTLHAE